MEIDKKAIGSRIKTIRHNKGMTLHEFGSVVDEADRSIASRWERGISLPNNARLKIIADLGEITVDELLYGNQYEYTYKLINDIYDQLETSKKIFSADEREEITGEILQKITNSPLFKRVDYLSPEYKEYVEIIFELIFEGYFTKEVISNENAIQLVINKLESIQLFIGDYFSYDPERDTTIKTEKLDSDLEVKLHDLIEDARISAEELIHKYKKD